MQAELTLHTSNALDILVDRLADNMTTSPLSPLEREILIVQSQGMERWITMHLARRHGISGGMTFPYPRPFCHWLGRRVLDGAVAAFPDSEPISNVADHFFDREILTWRLFGLLGTDEAAKGPERAPDRDTAAYLSGDADQRKRLQLAARLADLFDEYQMFRPDVLRAWERGDGAPTDAWAHADAERAARWQAPLWRRLVSGVATAQGGLAVGHDLEPLHRRLDHLIDVLRRARRPAGVPSRVTVVGVSSLPPVFLDLLAALSRHIPVSIYFVSPTYHYWGDLRSAKETNRLARRLRVSPEHLLDEQHFQEGHALLAALGRQGRDFFNLLQQVDPSGSAWQELAFVEPGGEIEDEAPDRALHVLQHDILHLVQRSIDERPVLDPEDISLEVHACHSPLREMEVLRDRLLDACCRDPSLRPGDILVQVPDIELYGPYIQAVFGGETGSGPRLPFSIADRRAGREQPLSEVFLEVLDLVGERLTVRQIFNLLDNAALRRRFELDDDEIPTLRRLVDDVAIRWAMDGAQKLRDFQLPAWDSNTWRAGLDRLLLGYAIGPSEELVAGIVPAAGRTAGSADMVGRFAELVERLFTVLRTFSPERNLTEWTEVLLHSLDSLFLAETESEEKGLQWVRNLISRLGETATRIGLDEAVSQRTLRDFLAGKIHGDGFGSGFIDGRITFCALKPMRTIPFQVVCIAGLNDGAFPRRDRRRSFDLMAAEPRPGDRSLRDDDRYLFLETLLAAQRRLLLSYVGRSQKDSARREPSVVLEELLDQVDRTFQVAHEADGGGRRDRRPRDLIVTEHRLQAWSPAYFDPDQAGAGRRFWSFAEENARAAQALASVPSALPRFAEHELHGADEALLDPHGSFELELRLDELQRFWRLPCAEFCRRTLGLSLDLQELEERETEPFLISGLDAYGLRQWLLGRRLKRRRSGETSGEGDRSREAESEQNELFFDALPPEQHPFAPEPPSGDRNGGTETVETAETTETEAEAEARDLRLLRAQGRVPALDLGTHQLRGQSRRVETFLKRLPDLPAVPPRTVDVRAVGEELSFRITGTVRHEVLGDDGPVLLHYRCARLRPVDQIQVWIELLIVALEAEQGGRPVPSALLVGEDATVWLEAPDRVESFVIELVEEYCAGLRRPLPVFGDASHAFAVQDRKAKDPRSSVRRTPMEMARQAFEGRALPGGIDLPDPEAEDPYVRLAFRGEDPLEHADFGAAAERLWKPIFDHAREESR